MFLKIVFCCGLIITLITIKPESLVYSLNMSLKMAFLNSLIITLIT